jgi:DNA replication regulator DPB11
VCLAEERTEIAELVRANGAVYEGDLTRSITHLICFRTEGAKYKAARAWGLRIVSIEWLRDSLERGMILEEQLYDPMIPVEERGNGAWDRTKPKRTSFRKRPRDGSDSLDGGKRKLRRTASTKLNSQSEGIWGDIVGGNTVAQVSRSGVWDTNDAENSDAVIQPKAKDPIPSRRVESFQSTVESPAPMKGMFGHCRFYLHGFDTKKTEILQGHLLAHDAEIASTVDDLFQLRSSRRLFRIVAHDLPRSHLPSLPITDESIETITLWWVERCLHHKRFESPREHVIGQPFPTIPIEGFADGTMVISSSAFTGIDLLHFKKAVQLIGATYSEDMTPKSSVLVTKSLNAIRKDKFDYAQEWKIPIVTANWLWDSISAGQRLPLSKYRCRPPKRSGSLPATGASLSKELAQSDRPLSEARKSPSPVDHAHKPVGKTVLKSAIDRSAFDPDEPIVKKESMSQAVMPLPEASNPPCRELSCTSEPSSERSQNSPSRTVSTAPAPSCHPAAPPPPDLSSEISNLLSKAKATTVGKSTLKETTEVRKRTNRILGRATSGSNISVRSNSLSRATSVDSTATSGYPVDGPPTLKDQASNERMEMLLNNEDRNRQNNDESQPSMTQLQYLDVEALEARKVVMAKMMCEDMESLRGTFRPRETALTIGDLVGSVNPKRASRRSGRASR